MNISHNICYSASKCWTMYHRLVSLHFFFERFKHFFHSQHDVISGCQTVKIVIPKPELAVQVPKTVFVRFQYKKEVTEPFKRLWKTVQPPQSVFLSHDTCIGLPLSGLIVYRPEKVNPSWRTWAQLLIDSLRHENMIRDDDKCCMLLQFFL